MDFFLSILSNIIAVSISYIVFEYWIRNRLYIYYGCAANPPKDICDILGIEDGTWATTSRQIRISLPLGRNPIMIREVALEVRLRGVICPTYYTTNIYPFIYRGIDRKHNYIFSRMSSIEEKLDHKLSDLPFTLQPGEVCTFYMSYGHMKKDTEERGIIDIDGKRHETKWNKILYA